MCFFLPCLCARGSDGAKNCVNNLLQRRIGKRYTAAELLRDPWVSGNDCPTAPLEGTLSQLKKFNARYSCHVVCTAITCLCGFAVQLSVFSIHFACSIVLQSYFGLHSVLSLLIPSL